MEDQLHLPGVANTPPPSPHNLPLPSREPVMTEEDEQGGRRDEAEREHTGVWVWLGSWGWVQVWPCSSSLSNYSSALILVQVEAFTSHESKENQTTAGSNGGGKLTASQSGCTEHTVFRSWAARKQLYTQEGTDVFNSEELIGFDLFHQAVFSVSVLLWLSLFICCNSFPARPSFLARPHQSWVKSQVHSCSQKFVCVSRNWFGLLILRFNEILLTFPVKPKTVSAPILCLLHVNASVHKLYNSSYLFLLRAQLNI